MLSATKGMVSQSRVEACYDMNAEELRSTMPGFNESNDHFNGVMYYKVRLTVMMFCLAEIHHSYLFCL
jgi:hypothetical protein